MPHHQIEQKALEEIFRSGPPALMAAIGWFAHTLATAKKIPEAHRLVGGVMLAGFVGWVGVVILTHTFSIPPDLAAAIASIIGSSGGKGYRYLKEISTPRSKE